MDKTILSLVLLLFVSQIVVGQEGGECPFSIKASSFEVHNAHLTIKEPYLSVQNLLGEDDRKVVEVTPWEVDSFWASTSSIRPPVYKPGQQFETMYLTLHVNAWSQARYTFSIEKSDGEMETLAVITNSNNPQTIELGHLLDYLVDEMVNIHFSSDSKKALYIDSLYLMITSTKNGTQAEKLFEEVVFELNHDHDDWYQLQIHVPTPVLCYIHSIEYTGTTVNPMYETNFETFVMEIPSLTAIVSIEMFPGREYILDISLLSDEADIYRQYVTLRFDGEPECIDTGVMFLPALPDPNDNPPAISELTIGEITSSTVYLNFTSMNKGRNAFILENTETGEYMIRRSKSHELNYEHSLTLIGLKPDTDYSIKAYFKQDEEVKWFSTQTMTFRTLMDEAGNNGMRNVALLSMGATSSSSSNFGGGGPDSSFGSNKAIDGDDNTEWSSNSQGNSAVILITLRSITTVTGFGLFTRSMSDGSSIVKTVKILNANNGAEVGTFNIESELEMQIIVLDTPVESNKFRFDVVESTGGNTGFKTIEIYENYEVDLGENIALLDLGATVEVSSNWLNQGLDSTFGGNNAIDNDDTTEWSSNFEGNNAYISIILPEDREVTGFALWTRSMSDGSGIVKQVEITNVMEDSMVSIGIFEIESEIKIQTIALNSPVTGHKFMFIVRDSTGGNTGFKTIEIFSH